MRSSRSPRSACLGLLSLSLATLSACGDSDTDTPTPEPDASTQPSDVLQITASGELPSTLGDPDDPAIWVNAEDPSKSLILTTDKENGLFVHDLQGNERQALPGYELNNVDLRYGFSLDGRTVDLAIATDRKDDTLAIFTIDPETGEVSEAKGSGFSVGQGSPFPVYGGCLYHPKADELYAFVNTKGGAFKQFLLEDDGTGSVAAQETRMFGVGSQPEGCVADDENGVLFLGEEGEGLHRIDADPDGNDTPELIDHVDNGNLSADVEGIALYRTGDGKGYVLVSSQGDDTVAVYERTGSHKYLGKFHVGAGEFDEVTHSDGLEVTHAALSPDYPSGLLVLHDDRDDTNGKPAFKLVDWKVVAEAFDPPLQIDTSAPL